MRLTFASNLILLDLMSDKADDVVQIAIKVGSWWAEGPAMGSPKQSSRPGDIFNLSMHDTTTPGVQGPNSIEKKTTEKPTEKQT